MYGVDGDSRYWLEWWARLIMEMPVVLNGMMEPFNRFAHFPASNACIEFIIIRDSVQLLSCGFRIALW